MGVNFSSLLRLIPEGSELLAHTPLPSSRTASICRIKLLIKIQAFQMPISKAGINEIINLLFTTFGSSTCTMQIECSPGLFRCQQFNVVIECKAANDKHHLLFANNTVRPNLTLGLSAISKPTICAFRIIC